MQLSADAELLAPLPPEVDIRTLLLSPTMNELKFNETRIMARVEEYAPAAGLHELATQVWDLRAAVANQIQFLQRAQADGCVLSTGTSASVDAAVCTSFVSG